MAVRRPRPPRVELPHWRGLDGLRGLAVLAVVLYHAGVPWAAGGFIGVELFFVLSGFLITSLLLAEWRAKTTIALGAFWGRRARRLLPALLAVIVVVGVYYAIAGPDHAIPGLKNDGIATLLYFGNWHQIAANSSYFAATGPVSPLQHTWSLAIEEQFYLVWPLLLLGILGLAGWRARTERQRLASLRILLLLSVLGALLSALDMALLYHGSASIDRIYYGTDTRAFSLLIGASLAIWRALRSWLPTATSAARSALGPPPLLSARRRRALDAAGVCVLCLLGVLAVVASGQQGWMYPWGLLAVDGAAVVLIITAVTRPWAPAGRLLRTTALVRLGTISYGLYLWHFPLFQWLDESSTGLAGTPLLIVRLLVALGVSVASYAVIERPIRRRRLAGWAVRALTPVAAGGAVASLLLGASLSSISFAEAASDARTLPKPPADLQGSGAACRQTLTDAPAVGLAPLPPARAEKTEYSALGHHRLTWKGSAGVTFHTCPPKRVLIVGDSLAYTIGVGMMENEQRYGTELANAAILGCAFTATGQLQVSGSWENQSVGCSDALPTWGREADALHAQAVVVELGYRDQFDWKLDGRVEHLGQRSFDAALQQRIDRYIGVLGAAGRKVLFLSVPYSQPAADPDGSPSVAGAPARHELINAMIRRAASGHPNVSVLDIDKVISPHGRYAATLNGKLCRFDGIHFTLYCAGMLQPYVLADVRSLLGTG
jgi:peptidoglycan/LPS O-acetylase OafA/YrhL